MKRAKVKSDPQAFFGYCAAIFKMRSESKLIHYPCTSHSFDKNNELESLKCKRVFCKDSLNTEVFQTLCMSLPDYFLITQHK
jgi:hypothetical protein